MPDPRCNSDSDISSGLSSLNKDGAGNNNVGLQDSVHNVQERARDAQQPVRFSFMQGNPAASGSSQSKPRPSAAFGSVAAMEGQQPDDDAIRPNVRPNNEAANKVTLSLGKQTKKAFVTKTMFDEGIGRMETMIKANAEAQEQFQASLMAALRGQWVPPQAADEPEDDEEGPKDNDTVEYGSPSHVDSGVDFSSGDGQAPAVVQSHPPVPPPVASLATGFANRFTGPELGPPIADDLAQSLKFMMQEKLDEKALAGVMDLYDTPGNCPELRVPKVNAAIWDNVPARSRNIDLKLQRVQKSLVRGITAACRAAPQGSVSQAQEDSFACLANANFELNLVRKELLKPQLNPRFAQMCKPAAKVSEFLFGDDLGQQVKEMNDAQKATGNLLRRGQAPRYQPYTVPTRNFSSNRPGPSSNQQGYNFNQSGQSYNKGQRNNLMPFLAQMMAQQGSLPPLGLQQRGRKYGGNRNLPKQGGNKPKNT